MTTARKNMASARILPLLPALCAGTAVAAAPADRTWPEKPGDAEVCLWRDDAFAAGSITIDDNNAFDHAWWMEQAKRHDVRLTWFVITDNVDGPNKSFGGTWEGWQRLADAGHSIQSHSTNHRGPADKKAFTEAEWTSYYGGSKEAINSHLTNNACVCIAYPGGVGVNTFNPDYTKRFFIAGRGGSGTPNPPNRTNYLNVNAVSNPNVAPYLDVVLGRATDDPKLKWLNNPSFRRGWFVSIIHAVQARTNEVGALVSAFASRRPELWVDTFPCIAKYGQERDTATVRTVSLGDGRIELELADGMDDALFDEPLTVKVRLPDGWRAVRATQAGRPVAASVVAHDGASFALVGAVPDRGSVVVEKGSVRP